MNLFVTSLLGLLLLVTYAADYTINDECRVVMPGATPTDTNPLLYYLEEFRKQEKDPYCINFGPFFGPWGAEACPRSLDSIAVAAKKGFRELSGGKGQEKPMLLEGYVLKKAVLTEVQIMKQLLDKMQDNYYRRNKYADSLMAPICRLLAVSDGGEDMYFTVTLKIDIPAEIPGPFAWRGKYDLKGNCKAARRMAEEIDGRTLKDGNFYKKFPHGLFISNDTARSGMRRSLLIDTEILRNLTIMDYSIFIVIAQLDDTAPVCRLHSNKLEPLFWATSMGKTYVFALGMIDLFMSEDKRGTLNDLGEWSARGARGEACSQDDIDPIPAGGYRARFLQMVDHVEDGFPCLLSRPPFVYFPSEGFPEDCSDSANETCKHLCEHLGYSQDCANFEAELEACKNWYTLYEGYRTSSTWDVRAFMKTRVREVDVLMSIGKLRQKISTMFENKKKEQKYKDCLKPVMVRMDRHEGKLDKSKQGSEPISGRTMVLNTHSLVVHSVPSQSLDYFGYLREDREDIPIRGVLTIHSDAVVVSEAGIANALDKLPVLRQLRQHFEWQNLAKITIMKEAGGTVFEINVPDHLELKDVYSGVALTAQKREDGTYHIVAARITKSFLARVSRNVTGASGNEAELRPIKYVNDIRNYLSYELYLEIQQKIGELKDSLSGPMASSKKKQEL